MAVNSGKYKDRISVAVDAGVRSKFGGSTGERNIVQRPWCKVRHISDNEDDGIKTKAQLILELEMRYSKSMENPTADMYIIFRKVEYDIISSINVNMRNEKLLVMVKRR